MKDLQYVYNGSKEPEERREIEGTKAQAEGTEVRLALRNNERENTRTLIENDGNSRRSSG